ncbi:MAG TPA: WD40 repeat domain-containing protein [Flavobacteriales bacterium]|nr:WD40 repeat domain-containing protein [Flavobacteriales bacterium]
MSARSFHPNAMFQGHKAAVYALCSGSTTNSFLSAGGDGIVVQWRVDQPDKGEALVNVGEAVFSLCLLARRELLVIGTGTGRLLVIDLRTRNEVQAIAAHTKGVFRICLLDPNTLACAGGDGTLTSWSLSDERMKPLIQLRRIPLCEEKLRDIALSAKGERLVVACGDGSLRELDLPTLNERQRFEGHEKGSNCVAFHPTKPVLISGGKDGQVKVWRPDGGCLLEFAAHKGSVYATSMDPTGRYLATAGRDALLKVWDANTLGPVHRSTRERSAHTHSINAVLWLGKTLITASDDRTLKAWVP